MIEESEALELILAASPDLPAETIPLIDAQGRFLKTSISAGFPVPPFDCSAMDGYAVRAEDGGVAGAVLAVVGEQPAGPRRPGLRVGEGECVRIFTGAALPEGADAVIMQEDVEVDGCGNIVIKIPVDGVGEFVRPAGGDVVRGQRLAKAGDLISPGVAALLASQGIAEVAVGRRLRAGVVTTGDEVVPAGEPLGDGQIYNSNGAMLKSLVERSGGEVRRMAHGGDSSASELGKTLSGAAEGCDLILVSGGVSVGAHDHVPEALAAAGFERVLWKIALKPGKPLYVARRDGAIAIGLPGNPASSFVCFALFVFPALRAAMGAPGSIAPLPRVSAVAGQVYSNRGDRPVYLRGRMDEEGRFCPVGLQQSHSLVGLSGCTSLGRLGAGEAVEEGARMEVVSLVPLGQC